MKIQRIVYNEFMRLHYASMNAKEFTPFVNLMLFKKKFMLKNNNQIISD